MSENNLGFLTETLYPELFLGKTREQASGLTIAQSPFSPRANIEKMNTLESRTFS